MLYILKNRQIGHGPEWEYLVLSGRGETLKAFEARPSVATRYARRHALEAIAPMKLLHLWTQ